MKIFKIFLYLLISLPLIGFGTEPTPVKPVSAEQQKALDQPSNFLNN